MAKARIPKSARFTAKSVWPPQGLPDRETLLKFIREAGETDKADMAKAFGLAGTPSFAIGSKIYGGVLDPTGLAQVVLEARGKRT